MADTIRRGWIVKKETYQALKVFVDKQNVANGEKGLPRTTDSAEVEKAILKHIKQS